MAWSRSQLEPELSPVGELERLGWNASWQSKFDTVAKPGMIPARVVAEHRALYDCEAEDGPVQARVRGRLFHLAWHRAAYPAVGDWVILEPSLPGSPAAVHTILPRESCFSRRDPGPERREQILACNLDTLLVVTSCNRDFNPRRLERFVTAVAAQKIEPVILLNKADLLANVAPLLTEVRRVLPRIECRAISALDGAGLEELDPWLTPGRTLALAGTSGVGKSTLLNRLLGVEVLETGDIRARDSRGRHTSVRRELHLLPNGAAVIDNPGIRELQLWDGSADTTPVFNDLAELEGKCRFRDCQHGEEPGCAIREAIEAGSVDEDRIDAWHKLRRELDYQRSLEDPDARRVRHQKWRKVSAQQKKLLRDRDRERW
jgi:ribosome biogenesis GTPase